MVSTPKPGMFSSSKTNPGGINGPLATTIIPLRLMSASFFPSTQGRGPILFRNKTGNLEKQFLRPVTSRSFHIIKEISELLKHKVWPSFKLGNSSAIRTASNDIGRAKKSSTQTATGQLGKIEPARGEWHRIAWKGATQRCEKGKPAWTDQKRCWERQLAVAPGLPKRRKVLSPMNAAERCGACALTSFCATFWKIKSTCRTRNHDYTTTAFVTTSFLLWGFYQTLEEKQELCCHTYWISKWHSGGVFLNLTTHEKRY